MSTAWDQSAPGVVTLPSGRRVRGRGLRRGPLDGPEPELGVYLVTSPPPQQRWEARWVKWRDFWVPSSPAEAVAMLRDAWQAAADHRVEFACGGGVGRTGTALACLAVIEGLDAGDAVEFVREHYHHRAVETPWQRRFVRQLGPTQ
ncbi:MAG TPA: protein-tyrosine phosphatase family protein [Kineosporiaceae bacterium]